jgi:two-component sensor histidine kinase
VEAIGAPSIDWLGVPLKIGGRVIGILVIQSYTEGVRYREEDKNILKFFSGQAAMAIHRKQSERALKASLAEKEVLLREIHHRVKNNMQVISSLLSLQAGQLKDGTIIEMFRESQRRIRSMALVHERLYQSADFSHIDFSEYVRSLAVHLFHSCQVNSGLIRLNMDAEKTFININTAVPLGLIVNELISNALKHAFPDSRSGEVMVTLRRIGEHDFTLSVRDNGIGFPRDFDFSRMKSLGMQIVMTLINQIDARIERRPADGTDFEIIFREKE